jgi:trk system potassium uptake protein TrkA
LAKFTSSPFTMFGPRQPTRLAEEDSVVVIGLGRFGSALALELMASGTEVLGIDGDEEVVQAHNRLLTHVVRADSTKEDTLLQLGVPEFSSVVVAIGGDIQANILTASLLLKLGIPNIWAKSVSEPHGEILRQLGVNHVIYPEKDMGKRVAHLVRGVMQDYIDIGENFALVKTAPPQEILDKPLSQTKVRTVHGVTVTAFHRAGRGWNYATMETVIEEGDIILVAGETKRVESFSRLP